MATKDERLQLRVDADLKERFRRYADRRKLDMSQLIEDFIRRLLKREAEDDA